MDDPYSELGVRRVINASTTLTALGGSLMPPEVVAAMAAAARSYVDMHELHEAVGRELAVLTGNAAATVTSGAAAGLTLAVLACATAGDPAAIAGLPTEFADRPRVVMHCAHRIPYDRAVEFAGGRIVQIGNAIQTFEWELERALDPKPAAVLWVAGEHLAQTAVLGLARCVAVAHERGVPVIVDAAAQLPPASNLWHFTRELGADLAVFSGGKALRGPQASGLLLGRPDLIAAARANAAPHQRLARALKVGKEEIVGLLAAVQRYLTVDHEAERQAWENTVADWQRELSVLPWLRAARAFPNEAGQPVPRLHVQIVRDAAGVDASEIVRRLWDRNPRIAVLPAPPDGFYLTPDTLVAGEADLVLAALRSVMTAVAIDASPRLPVANHAGRAEGS